MSRVLAEEPLATPAYVSVADGRTLAEIDRVADDGAALLSIAVRFGATRLIDNEPVGESVSHEETGTGSDQRV
jgi:pantothenate synthetase